MAACLFYACQERGFSADSEGDRYLRLPNGATIEEITRAKNLSWPMGEVRDGYQSYPSSQGHASNRPAQM